MTRRKTFDLQQRTFEFSRDVRAFVKKLPRTVGNLEDMKQLIRSSGSVGANYIEANESLSKKDARFRISIARKEAKETRYWLALLDTENDTQLEKERICLHGESNEIFKILCSIREKM